MGLSISYCDNCSTPLHPPPDWSWLGLALKYLPDLIRAPASAYRDIQEGRHTTAKRKRLLARAAADERLAKLDKKTLGQLASILTRVYEMEERHIASSQKF